MDANRPAYELSDYFGMLRRTWWIVVIACVVGVGAAAAFTLQQPKVFESTTSVQVLPGPQDTNVVGGRTRGDINPDNEAQLVRAGEVATKAKELMKSNKSADQLRRNVTVEAPANTSVLRITCAARTAREAQACSHAFAEAYLRNREDAAKADIATQIKILETQIQQIQVQLQQVTGKLAALPANSPDRVYQETQKNNLANQLNALTSRLNQLKTTTVAGGRIISDAALPGKPSRPVVPLNLASGLMAGLILGIALAVGRERMDRRVRRGVDVERRSEVPLLAELPRRARPRFDDVFPTFGVQGRLFGRLRNEVVAGLQREHRIIVVTGASRGPASTLVASNLAAAFARSGNDVILVGAHVPDGMVSGTSVMRMLGVHATPGLSDVLAGRVQIHDAVQRAPRHPGLRIVPTGGAASSAGLLQSDAVRETLSELRQEAEYVIVEAPSTSASADAQSLASLADAAILAVELRRTTHAEVVDAAEQLRRVGTPVLGAVVLPRLKPPEPAKPGLPAMPALPPALAPGPPPAAPPGPRDAEQAEQANRAERAERADRADLDMLDEEPTGVIDTKPAAPAGPKLLDTGEEPTLVFQRIDFAAIDEAVREAEATQRREGGGR